MTNADRRAGWKPLFDGKTLNGWRGFSSETPGTGWVAENGELISRSPTGDLLTNAEFGDFELRLDWKLGKGANSGIIYRVDTQASTTYETGPEYQLLDNRHSTENDGLHSAGAIYDVLAPARDVTRPTGEWNEARIIVKGWNIQHWMNGEKILEVDLSSPAGQAMISRSKFRGMGRFASQLRGRIALQDHGDPVSFRRIVVRELPAPR